MKLNVAVGCLLASQVVCMAAAQSPSGQPPAVRRFHPSTPIFDRLSGGPARSTQLVRSIDVSESDSVSTPGAGTNTVLDVLFPPGAVIQGYQYDATFSRFSNPGNPAMGFRLLNQSDDDVVVNEDGGPVLAGGPVNLMPADQITIGDGHLRVEFFEAVDDLAGADGRWLTGTIDVFYEGSGVECCLWDNGPFDNRDGALSQIALNRQNPIYHVMADDFFLEPNYVHMIEYMEAVFIVLAPAAYAFDTPIGTLEVRTDCDGKPGDLLAEHDIVIPRDGLLGEIATPEGTALVYRMVAVTEDLCLKGGKPYWASFILSGISTQNGTDEWYWGTTGSPSVMPPYDPPLHVKGSLPHRQLEPNGVWERIDCATNDPNCLGCTDLNFCIRGERCKIVYDQSTYEEPPQPAAAGSVGLYSARSVDISGVTTRQARAADDVTISPCETALYPCVIEAYVWTTCTPPAAKLEIYETECVEDGNLPPDVPHMVRPMESPLPYTILAGEDDAVDQGFVIPAAGGGPPFRLYCFKFKDFDGFVFQPGRTYWISAIGTGGNNTTNDAYFAFSAPKCPEDECYRIGNEGHAKSAYVGSGYPDWTRTSLVPGLLEANDFAMLVATRNSPLPFTGQTRSCVADFDRSGQIAVADIFSFLSEWFSGCP